MILAVIAMAIITVFLIGYVVFFRVKFKKAVDTYISNITNLSMKVSELETMVNELDDKIGGEKWEEMVQAETEYAKVLAHNIQNLIDYNGEEQEAEI